MPMILRWTHGCADVHGVFRLCTFVHGVCAGVHTARVLVTLTGIFSTCARNVCTFAECVHIPNQHICATDTKTSQSDVRASENFCATKSFVRRVTTSPHTTCTNVLRRGSEKWRLCTHVHTEKWRLLHMRKSATFAVRARGRNRRLLHMCTQGQIGDFWPGGYSN